MVSIITPCYNAEKYIRQTIESVLAQTYTDWELLITDDCSNDSTIDIIKEYQQQDSRIYLFSTAQNTGHPSTPRNISISHAKGEYIAFVDSDDIWLPNKLAEQIQFMEDNHYDLITSYAQIIDENGNLKQQILKTKDVAGYKDFLVNYELLSPTIMCSTPVGKQLFFPEFPKEDYIAWVNVVKNGAVVHNTKQVHAYYRIASNSRSRNKLKMLYYQWIIYREQFGFGILPSCYYWCMYTLNVIIKYLPFNRHK